MDVLRLSGTPREVVAIRGRRIASAHAPATPRSSRCCKPSRVVLGNKSGRTSIAPGLGEIGMTVTLEEMMDML